MYVRKNKEASISPVQRRIGVLGDSKQEGMPFPVRKGIENLAEYNIDDVKIKYKPLQSQLFGYGLNSVIQRRDDSVKISPGKCGTDPTGIGLPCHHIIPAKLLETFYEQCTQYAGNNEQINISFAAWKNAAERSANNTQGIRDGSIERGGADYAKEQASACQWMAGNIFIGPSSAQRIDDLCNENAFDYGGYREESLHKKDNGNKTMDSLMGIYTDMCQVVQNFNIADPPVEQMCNILKRLTKVADKTVTLHKKNNNPTTAAYDINDWISVGGEIQGMEAQPSTFNNMYNDYEAMLKLLDRTPLQQEYCDLFRRHINTSKYDNLSARDSQCTISRYTYNILYNAWQRCKHQEWEQRAAVLKGKNNSHK